jgi:hypothetical protein
MKLLFYLGRLSLLTEMSTRNLPGGNGRPAHGADNLTAICELIVYKMWEPRRLTTLWAIIACYLYLILFICGLFNDAVSGSHCTAPNYRMVNGH